jgi:lipooligosaccharide transport system ATP-binding protein
MDEAEVLCDRIMVMDGGRVQAEGSPRALIERFNPGYVALFPDAAGSGQHERVEVPMLEGVATIAQSKGRHPELVRPANLEDVFLKLTGKNLHV